MQGGTGTVSDRSRISSGSQAIVTMSTQRRTVYRAASVLERKMPQMRQRLHQRLTTALIVVLSLIPTSCATVEPAHRWNDSYESRLEILALLQTLNADILASSSATATLERWCGDHDMAAPPTVVVQRVDAVFKTPTPEQLQRLSVADAAAVRYRRVQLRCGAHILSEADNWYVPSRLTTHMNQLLETSDIPFGKVVRELMPYRRTIQARLLWSPLPQGWESHRRPHSSFRDRRNALVIPKDLLVHTAVLYTSQHQPFSEVVETYQGELLAFGRH
jgi:chorismate-pyruvate lyase